MNQFIYKSFTFFVDKTLSLLAIIIFLLPLIIISILVKLTSAGPILHVSDRIGLNNAPFKMLKFRTMYLNTPNVATQHLRDPAQYLTKIGNFLRTTSLDELPQLFNILFGDMSLVGPRPALFNQYDLITLRTKLGIQKLKPGLTGYAQINGRDNIDITKKVELDYYYYLKRSIIFDFQILFKTFYITLLKKNIAH